MRPLNIMGLGLPPKCDVKLKTNFSCNVDYNKLVSLRAFPGHDTKMLFRPTFPNEV